MTVQPEMMTLETGSGTGSVGPVEAMVYDGDLDNVGDKSTSPVVLVFHGGAFNGALPHICPFAQTIAGTGAIVVMPDYNAPLGAVFPNPLKTGFSVFSFLARKRSGLGNRKSPLFVAGIEAGGNIAAAVALKARDYFADELDGQVLASPLLDPFMGSHSIRNAEAAEMRDCWSEGWSHYMSGGMCHPYAAPLTCSRLSGVAPALVLTAEDDPLRSETTKYAEALEASGVPIHQHVFPSGSGWLSIYGAKTETHQDWQADLANTFSEFAQAIQSN